MCTLVHTCNLVYHTEGQLFFKVNDVLQFRCVSYTARRVLYVRVFCMHVSTSNKVTNYCCRLSLLQLLLCCRNDSNTTNINLLGENICGTRYIFVARIIINCCDIFCDTLFGTETYRATYYYWTCPGTRSAIAAFTHAVAGPTVGRPVARCFGPWLRLPPVCAPTCVL